MEFDGAIRARQLMTNPQSSSGIACQQMMHAFLDNTNDQETAHAMPQFWNTIHDFEQYVQFSAVENRISQSLLMMSSSSAYEWVTRIATQAVTSSNQSTTWVQILAKDVQQIFFNIWNSPQPSQKEHHFNSEDYLPLLSLPSTAILPYPRFTYNKDTIQKEVINAVTLIIETWLQFPNDQRYKVSCTLLTILLSKMPPAILLLKEIWEMYLTPFSVVIHGQRHGQRQQRRSNPHITKTIQLFQTALQNHPLIDNNSNEFQLLDVLEKLAQTWFHLIAAKPLWTSTKNHQQKVMFLFL